MNQMTGRPSAGERLDSWKDISAYLGRDVSTVIRWEKEKGLPIRRIPGGQRQSVFAYKEELDAWLAGEREPNDKEPTEPNHRELTQDQGAGPSPAPEVTEPCDSEPPVAVVELDPPKAALEKVSFAKRAMYIGVGFIAALIAVAAYRYVQSGIMLRAPQLVGEGQLTSNGLEKKGLLTDGKTVYFGQELNGWYGLVAMPVSGGSIRVLWSPPANVTPLDISSDGQKLLALIGVGVQKDRELWVVSLNGGRPYRLSNILPIPPPGRLTARPSPIQWEPRSISSRRTILSLKESRRLTPFRMHCTGAGWQSAVPRLAGHPDGQGQILGAAFGRKAGYGHVAPPA